MGNSVIGAVVPDFPGEGHTQAMAANAITVQVDTLDNALWPPHRYGVHGRV